jgi:hypothetical protein
MRRTLLTLVLLALVSSAPAGAAIVPGKSIAGVKLGMTQGQVTGVLGAPAQTQHGMNEFGSFTVFRYTRLQVTFQGDVTVTAVKTTRKSEKTPHGVGVGSTKAELKAGVTKLKCITKSLCQKGRSLPGARVTVFRLFHGKVTSVLVGFVID